MVSSVRFLAQRHLFPGAARVARCAFYGPTVPTACWYGRGAECMLASFGQSECLGARYLGFFTDKFILYQ